MEASKRARILLAKLVKGQLSAAELAELQALAKTDPFLSDAVEGYLQHPKDHSDTLQALRRGIKTSKRRAPWRSIAATVLVLAGLSLFLINRYQPRPTEGLVMKEDHQKNEAGTRPSRATDAQMGSEVPVQDLPVQNNTFEALEQKEANSSRDASPSNRPSRSPETKSSPDINADREVQADLAEVKKTESFEELDDALAIRQRETLPLISVKGKVFDNVGQPLTGVRILQPDLGIVAFTDLEGQFVLTTPDTNQDISVSYAGYESKVVSSGINANKPLDIKLEEVVTLNEVAAVRAKPGVKQRPSEAMSPSKKEQSAFKSYVDQNLQYPPAARKGGVEGEVQLAFSINEEGRPVDIKVTKSLGYGCDQEAIRLLKNGPKWSMAQDGNTTEFKLFSVRVNFKLE